jgi:hypothetical protein
MNPKLHLPALLLAAVVACSSCTPSPDAQSTSHESSPVKEGDVSYICFRWAPDRTMMADSGTTEGVSATLYSNVFNHSRPHLELYANWARISYTAPDDPKTRVICVPLSSIIAFNWK